MRRMGVRALLMRTRLSLMGCPRMGRKADVSVARAKARVLGIMVMGWEVLGDIGDNLSRRM